MQVAKVAGGTTPGLLCCFAKQGAETQPPSLRNGAGFLPVPELEPSSLKHFRLEMNNL